MLPAIHQQEARRRPPAHLHLQECHDLSRGQAAFLEQDEFTTAAVRSNDLESVAGAASPCRMRISLPAVKARQASFTAAVSKERLLYSCMVMGAGACVPERVQGEHHAADGRPATANAFLTDSLCT